MMTITDVAAALAIASFAGEAAAAGDTKPAAAAAAKPDARRDAATIPMAGWRDGPYLRDESGRYFAYLGGRIDVDFYDFAGAGVTSTPATSGGLGLKARLFVRRLRPEVGGELWQFLSFYFAPEWGGQPLTNDAGKAETAAAAAGQAPTADTAQFAPLQAVGANATIVDAFLDLRALPELHFQVGQFYAPFSMENQTTEKGSSVIERSLAIRAFVVPQSREIGVAVWGDFGRRAAVLSYELGAFQGDGQNRAGVDNRFDGIGRVFVRPLAVRSGSPVQKLQIGMSARYGERDPRNVGYDLSAISTAGGWQLWKPTYQDSHGRVTHVLPSDAQMAIGGELRIPVWRFDVRGEAYWVDDGTREGIDGYQLTNVERFGTLRGIGWYAQLGVWAGGDAFITGDPGMSRRPARKNLAQPEKFNHGLELVGVVSGVNANYDGAARAGRYDQSTPGAPHGPGTRITAYQFSATANYWVTKHFRASASYGAYYTPGSGSTDNLAQVPGNVQKPADPGAHLFHEVSARLGASF